MGVMRRRSGGISGSGKVLLMGQDFVLVNRKVPVENVEHFAFHPTNVPMFENARTPRPDDVLHHLIV